jgi:membrane fusion protein
MSLFRKQALEHQFNRIWGEVNLTQAVSYKILTGLIVALVATALGFLFSQDYHQKQSVSGYLVPSEGVITLYAPSTMYVAEVLVEEGDHVEINQPLLRLKSRTQIAQGMPVHLKIKQELWHRLQLLRDKREQLKALSASNTEETQQQIKTEQAKFALYQTQIAQLQQRIALAQKHYDNQHSMLTQGFVSQRTLDEARSALLTLKQSLTSSKAQAASTAQEQKTLRLTLARLPLELQKAQQDVDIQSSELQQQLTQIEQESEQVITASKAGHITGMAVKKGQLLKNQQYLLSLMPNEGHLFAEILVPTRAFGFVKTGLPTRLKLDAFPYQKFGIIQGTVSQIPEYILLPKEANLPIEIKEPVYKVKVALDRQSIQAYGKAMALQAGMQLQADILVDSRSLIEWLFEPLLSLQGS